VIVEPVFPMAVAAGVFYGVVLAVIGRHRARFRAWHRAAAAARLEDIRASDRLFGAFLEGHAGGLQVRLERYRHGRYESGTRVVIQGLARLSVRREGVATAIEKRFLGETEIELGAPSFDERCFVNGSPALACSVLDADVRRRLASLVEGRLEVEEKRWLGVRAGLSEGTLRLECRDGWGVSSERVRDLLRGGLDLAQRLTLPPDVPQRIALNLRSEPEPGVRVAALLTLAREYPKHPVTRPALLAARQDASAEVRLRAAMALGAEGQETLRALVADAATNDACAARAVAALGVELPSEEAVNALRLALDSGHAETAIACLGTLSVRGTVASEDALLAALLCPLDDVRIAAARALGRAGTADAVRDLLAVSESGPGELRRAARQAIAEIQSRLPGASPGQLSLAGGEAGALSLAENVAGGLLLVERDEPAASGSAAEPDVAVGTVSPPTGTSPPVAPRAREHE
jgi:hypothetical protein